MKKIVIRKAEKIKTTQETEPPSTNPCAGQSLTFLG
jgi:hypothetical protein